jgi:hypothetical protein
VQSGTRIRKVFQHPAAHDGIEGSIRVRELGEIGGHVGDTVAFHAAPRSLQHILRIIEARNNCVWVRRSEKETGITAIAAARVEYVFATADIEDTWANQPPRQCLVSSDQTGYRRESPRQAIVMALDKSPIIREGTALRFFRFEDGA